MVFYSDEFVYVHICSHSNMQSFVALLSSALLSSLHANRMRYDRQSFVMLGDLALFASAGIPTQSLLKPAVCRQADLNLGFQMTNESVEN